MAQIINLRESEYQTITSELSKMHADQLQNVSDVITEVKALVSSGDAFSANLTSKKIEDVLDALSSEIMPLLAQAFRDSEAGVANMVKSIVVTDSTCSKP